MRTAPLSTLKRNSRTIALFALSLAILPVNLTACGGLARDPRTAVIPGLREWRATPGSLRLSDRVAIVLDRRASADLDATATVIAADLASLTRSQVSVRRDKASTTGDVFLSVSGHDPRLGREGYRLDIDDRVVIRANSAAGLFYGSRSLLQMIEAAGSPQLPRGHGLDYPTYPERGLVVDVSTRFVPVPLLEDYIRRLAWYKFNDLQLDLNDNGDMRLDDPSYPGLAPPHQAYSQADFVELEDFARARAITITPEIDSPGHASAFIRYRPQLAKPHQTELLNLADPVTQDFMARLWTRFLPWFTGPQVSIGADEYDPADGDHFRQYVNRLDVLLRAHGKTVRMWASLSREPGATPVASDIELDAWSTDWADPSALAKSGFRIVNVSSEYLYIVTPKTPWFADQIDDREIYERWQPNMFSRRRPAFNLPVDDPQLAGAMYAFWGDPTTADSIARIHSAMPVIGEKLWDAGVQPWLSFPGFAAAAGAVGQVPI